MMTHVAQGVRVETQSPPGRPVNPDELAGRIEDAVNQALSQVQDGQRDNARQSIREAVEQVRADIEAARAQGVERIVVQPQFGDNVIPPQAVDISIAFFVMLAFVIVGLPLARAFARRMDRRSEAAPAAADLAPRLERIEQAIDAVAMEVERISEGQRYTSKAIAEMRGLPASNAAGWPGGAREPAPASVEGGRRP